jgi:predicted enzyme related to lactoylglutathione lyase
MKIKKIELGWVIVSDFAKSKHFFTETLGLAVAEQSAEHPWMELVSQDNGMRIGVGEYCEEYSKDDKPGQNMVLALTVDDIVATKKELEGKGVAFIGDILEIPGNVKMATFKDLDGNKFQLVEHA